MDSKKYKVHLTPENSLDSESSSSSSSSSSKSKSNLNDVLGSNGNEEDEVPDLPAMALNKFASAMPSMGLGKKDNSIMPKTVDNSLLALDKVDEAEEKSDKDNSKEKKVMFAETKVVAKKPSQDTIGSLRKRRQSFAASFQKSDSKIKFDELILPDKQMKKFIRKGVKDFHYSDKPTRQQLYYLYKLIINRRPFSYSWGDWLRSCLIKSCLCCKLKKSTNKFMQAYENDKIYQRGKEKLHQDLDIVKLIQRAMKSEMDH